MQERTDKQIKIIPLHEQLNTILRDYEKFKCAKGNVATYVCSESQCLESGLICKTNNCQCQKTHFKCKQIFFSRVLQNMLKKNQNISQQVKQSYKVVYQKINKMIDDLSNLRDKFQLQEKYFGLMKQQMQIIQLISQNKTKQINGKIISFIQNNFDIQFVIQSKQQITQDFQTKRIQFDKLYDSIQISYRKKDKNISNFCKDSKIIIKNQSRQLIKQWLCQGRQHLQFKISSKLLFRASENQFSKEKFKQICSNIPDTLVIVLNEHNKIIGGFTHQNWTNNQNNNYWDHQNQKYTDDTSKQSFLFSIDLQQKYKCKDYVKSIKNVNEFGPMFGQQDLYISQDANTSGKTYSNFPISYNLESTTKKPYLKNQQTCTLLTGSPNAYFKVKQYEVYQILGLN